VFGAFWVCNSEGGLLLFGCKPAISDVKTTSWPRRSMFPHIRSSPPSKLQQKQLPPLKITKICKIDQTAVLEQNHHGQVRISVEAGFGFIQNCLNLAAPFLWDSKRKNSQHSLRPVQEICVRAVRRRRRRRACVSKIDPDPCHFSKCFSCFSLNLFIFVHFFDLHDSPTHKQKLNGPSRR